MADVAIAVQDCTAATPTAAAATEVIITVFTFIELHLNVGKMTKFLPKFYFSKKTLPQNHGKVGKLLK
jgi:hypothetical protein